MSISVVNLKIKNFMSISEAEIKPGKVNVISGRNEQGKTTILKALHNAAVNNSNGDLVKHGADQAEIIVELKDEYVIDRKIKKDGSSRVNVSRGHGEEKEKLSGPQGIIDRLFNNVAFNPVDLLSPENRNKNILAAIQLVVTPERIAQELNMDIQDLPPVDFGSHGLKVLDNLHQYYYQRRAEANKDYANKKSKYEVMAKDFGVLVEPSISAASIDKMRADYSSKMSILQDEKINHKIQIDRITNANKEVAINNEKLQIMKEELAMCDMEITRLQDALERANDRNKKIKKDIHDFQNSGAKFELTTVFPGPSFTDLENEINEISHKIKDAENEYKIYESRLSQMKMVEAMSSDANFAKEVADAIDNKVSMLKTSLRAKLMSETGMPVDGLEYIDGAFYLNNVAIDQLSSSAILKLAIAIARKLASRTKLICIDGAEMIDDENFKLLMNEISDDEFTYFITRVGEPVEGSHKNFVMDNGNLTEV